MDWIEVSKQKPGEREVVLTQDENGYYEVCVYRGSPHSPFQTRHGATVKAAYWVSISAPERCEGCGELAELTIDAGDNILCYECIALAEQQSQPRSE